MAAHYIPNYGALVDDLARAGSDPDKITMVLGLVADVWPIEIRVDALDDEANARKLDWRRGIRS